MRVGLQLNGNAFPFPVLAVNPIRSDHLHVAYADKGETAVTFTNEFRITTTNFPAAFPGTLIVNTNLGYYDPVYPPGDVSLHWWWEEWPEPIVTFWGHMEHHVGEYNGAYADQQFVHITWADNRLRSVSTNYSRNQGDIRSLRLSWPK